MARCARRRRSVKPAVQLQPVGGARTARRAARQASPRSSRRSGASRSAAPASASRAIGVPALRATSGSLRRQFGCSSIVPGRLRLLGERRARPRAAPVTIMAGERGNVGVRRRARPPAGFSACAASMCERRAAHAICRARPRAVLALRFAGNERQPLARIRRSRPAHQPASVGRSCVLDGRERVARIRARRARTRRPPPRRSRARGTTARCERPSQLARNPSGSVPRSSPITMQRLRWLSSARIESRRSTS